MAHAARGTVLLSCQAETRCVILCQRCEVLPGEPCRLPRCGDGLIDWVPGPGTGGTGGASTGSGGATATGGIPGKGGWIPSSHLEPCDDGNNVAGDGCFDCTYEWRGGTGGAAGSTGGAKGL